MAESKMFRSLTERNARLFFTGLMVSNIGTWIQLTAMSLLVYRLTGRATDLGITIALQFIPMLVLGAWAGAVADRHNKRRLTLYSQIGLALQALSLGIMDLTGIINLPLVFVSAFVLGVINAIDNPARRGFVTELVDPENITNAISLNTAVMTGSRIFGPALAALLIGPLGTGWLFTLNGLSFAAIVVSLLMIDVSSLRTPPMAPRGGTPVRDALRYVASQRTLLVLFVVFTVISTFAFNYNVAIPKIADEFWGGDHLFGWLLTVVSVGSLTGSLLTARLQRVSVWWMVMNGALLSAGGLAVAWAPNLVLVMIAAIPLGIGGAGFITGMNAIAQQECPPEMRGRILALTAVAFLGSTPIGGPITGWVGDNIGTRWALGYGAMISVIAVIGLLLWVLMQHSEERDSTRGDVVPARSAH